ncbi:MAG: hypothetical protein GWP27_02745 [Bacteroidetes bacterium]|nr:hypothetical protein [Bacteroidota bacterium]
MRKVGQWLVLFGLILVVASCAEEVKKEEAEVVVEDVLSSTPFTHDFDYDTCLIISHKVDNYDVWKASYDLSEEIRLNHGIKTIKVYQGKVDKKYAMVLTSIENVSQAKGYVTSDMLENSMQIAGVEGDIEIQWMRQKLEYTENADDSILMYMSFSVIDYERWEEAFLDDYGTGESKDFEVTHVLQGVDDEGLVTMLFQVNDHDYVQKMESNNSFQMKMLAAGVVSYPTIYKLDEREI